MARECKIFLNVYLRSALFMAVPVPTYLPQGEPGGNDPHEQKGHKMENKSWSLAQLIAWMCLRSEAVVQRVGGAADQAAVLDAEVRKSELVHYGYGDVENFKKGFFVTGKVPVFGTADGQFSQIPAYDWRFLELGRPECITHNKPHMITWSEREAAYDYIYGRPATEGEKADFHQMIQGVKHWEGLRFPVDQIMCSDMMPPCRMDEALWDLQETVGYIQHGYPLRVFGSCHTGEFSDHIANSDAEHPAVMKLRKALQSGNLSAAGRMHRSSNAPFMILEREQFYHLSFPFNSIILNRVFLNGVDYDLTFQSADVRALFPPPEAVGAQTYRNGCPGRPTSRQLVEGELKRRKTAGELAGTLAKESRYLKAWLSSAHPTAPQMTQKTIENTFRNVFKHLKSLPAAA